MATPTVSASTIATVNMGSATPASPFHSTPAAAFTAQDSASEIIIIVCGGFATSSEFGYDDILIDGVGIATTGAVKRAEFISTAAFEQAITVFTIQPADAGWPGAVSADYVAQGTGQKQQKLIVYSMEDVDATTPFSEIDSSGGTTDGGTSASSSTTGAVASDQVLLGFSGSFDGAPTSYNPSDSGTVISSVNGTGSDIAAWRETGAGSTMTCELGISGGADIQMFYLVIQDTPAVGGGPKGPLGHPFYGAFRGPIS